MAASTNYALALRAVPMTNILEVWPMNSVGEWTSKLLNSTHRAATTKDDTAGSASQPNDRRHVGMG
jgi:hypothetical protein